MKFNRLAKISLICTAVLELAGCATQSTPEWRPYKDIDGKIKQVAFTQLMAADEMEHPEKMPDLKIFHGSARSKSGNEISKLGNLIYLINGDKVAMAAIFNVAGKSFNPQNAEFINPIAKAKSFDFYEFGLFRLSHAKFTAKTEICQDFNSKNGVDLLMTTNYYPENSFTDFYTALINVKLHRNNPPKEIGYTPSFTGQDERLQTELKSNEQKNGKQLATANIKEKASILFNIICK
ncbi:hypothetical protein A4G18_02845 [Pasteurellaceae bacterium Pebbles2]|nr:hypothetical protein [Pasteurellaceae bacterium Pebbles2]